MYIESAQIKQANQESQQNKPWDLLILSK